jgi:hypothetical protein
MLLGPRAAEAVRAGWLPDSIDRSDDESAPAPGHLISNVDNTGKAESRSPRPRAPPRAPTFSESADAPRGDHWSLTRAPPLPAQPHARPSSSGAASRAPLLFRRRFDRLLSDLESARRADRAAEVAGAEKRRRAAAAAATPARVDTGGAAARRRDPSPRGGGTGTPASARAAGRGAPGSAARSTPGGYGRASVRSSGYGQHPRGATPTRGGRAGGDDKDLMLAALVKASARPCRPRAAQAARCGTGALTAAPPPPTHAL